MSSSWPKEPQRGIRYTTPDGWRMVVLSAQRYSKDAGPGWATRVMRQKDEARSGRYRVEYVGSWPPYAGCVSGWPGDHVVEPAGVDQLELFGSWKSNARSSMLVAAPAPGVGSTKGELTNTEARMRGLDASADTERTSSHTSGKNQGTAAA